MLPSVEGNLYIEAGNFLLSQFRMGLRVKYHEGNMFWRYARTEKPRVAIEHKINNKSGIVRSRLDTLRLCN